ncbi:MAG TPA: hypothetical protein VML01_01105 [Bryobacterales bacterium]|nr:hypothetical protein [Bryobacterales bacterium]
MLQVIKVLRPPRGSLIPFKHRQTDHINRYAGPIRYLLLFVTFFEIHPRHRRHEFDAEGWHAHANDMAGLAKEFGPQIRVREAECPNGGNNPVGILSGGVDPQIDIGRSANMTMQANRVSTNQQVADFMFGEQSQELSEVAR